MTTDAVDETLSVPADYVPGVRGHTILAVGPDRDGTEVAAIWRVGPLGHPAGAWVLRLGDIAHDPEPAGRILRLCVGDGLLDRDIATARANVDRLVPMLPPEPIRALRAHAMAVADLLAEIAERRHAYQDAFDAYRRTTKSKIVPLVWPEPPAVAAVRPQVPEDGDLPAVDRALALAAALRRAVQFWHEVEQVRYRRSYLRELSDLSPLPPRWLAALRAAATTVPGPR